ncbi:hypothetical protein L1887_34211 [Cichorium endivia]|nr:hypothetical protein L1887_34211 [Cichorium endivia]
MTKKIPNFSALMSPIRSLPYISIFSIYLSISLTLILFIELSISVSTFSVPAWENESFDCFVTSSWCFYGSAITVNPAIQSDKVFNGDATTRQVYDEGAKRNALSVVSGINCDLTKTKKKDNSKNGSNVGTKESHQPSQS